MPLIQFTPAFDGDEYHAPGLHIESEGAHEVTGAQLSYLTKTFPKRFSRVDEPDAEKQPAGAAPEVKEVAKPTQEPSIDKSAPQPAVTPVQSEPSAKTVLESVKSAVSGKKGKK